MFIIFSLWFKQFPFETLELACRLTVLVKNLQNLIKNKK